MRNDINFNTINSHESTITTESSFSIFTPSSMNKYIVLLFICLLSLANGLQLYIIPNEFRNDFKINYKLSAEQFNLFTYIYPFFYIIATIFTFSLIENLNKFKFVNPVTIF